MATDSPPVPDIPEANGANVASDVAAWQHVWFVRGLDARPVPDTAMIEINGVRGFLMPGDVALMWNLGRSVPSGGAYLEIGSWMGLSSILVATSMVASFNFGGSVTCVDTWEGSPEHEHVDEIVAGTLYETFQRNVEGAGMSSMITPVRGRSLDVVERFDDASLDVIFVDGDHSYAGCRADIEAYLPKLRPGGRMLGHDAIPEGQSDGDVDGGVRQAVHDVALERGLRWALVEPPRAHYVWELLFDA